MPGKRQRNAPPAMSKPLNHARTLSVADGTRCLDSVQMEELERSFRRWAEESPRADTRYSRKRILLIFLLIRYTGARLSEVLHLDLSEDVDCKNHIVRLHKTGLETDRSWREVEISEGLAAEIQKNLDDPGFKGASINPLWVDPAHVRRKFYERSEASGIPREVGSPEVIRRSRAVELMQSNVPLPVVQRILGHSTPNLAASYVEFSEGEIREVARYYVDKESRRKTSARNTFFGKVNTIRKGDVQAIVELVTLGGYRISSVITIDSLSRLGIKRGALIMGEVKAPWVMLYRGEREPDSTAENLFRGTVLRMTRGRITTEVVVRIPDGTELCSVITDESRKRLDIREREALWVAFSAFAVVLHVD